MRIVLAQVGPLSTLVTIYTGILFARLIISWFPQPPEWARPIYSFLYIMTEPVLRLVRPLIPPIRVGAAALDLSPIVIFVLLSILGGILRSNNL